MEARAAVLIFAMAAVAGLLLYLPFFLWFRYRRARAKCGLRGSFHITRAGFFLYGAMLVALFAGLGVGVFSPQSWMGAQVRTFFGGLGYATVVVVVTSVIEWGLVRRGARFWRRVEGPDLGQVLVGEKPDA